MKLGLAALAVAALAVCGAAALAAFNLRTFVAAHGEDLVARVERALERPFQVHAVSPSWLPLGIRLVEVVVGEDPRFGAAPFLVAPAVRIVVRPLPLVRGRVEVARVALVRPQVKLARDPGGRWNVASLGVADEQQGRPGGARARPRGKRRLRIPLEWVVGVAVGEIDDGRIEIEDRAGGARRLTAERVRLRAEDVRLGGAARLRIDAALFGGASPDTHLDLRVDRLGENDADHTPVVARAEVRDVDLATVAALAGLPDRYAGRLRFVSAGITGTLARFVVVLQVRSQAQQLRLGGLVGPPVPADLRARATYERGVFAFEEASLTAGSLSLAATGTLGVRPWRADVEVRSAAGTGVAVALTDPPIWLSDLAARVAIDRGAARIDSGSILLDGLPVAFAGRVTSFDPPAGTCRVKAEAVGGSFAGVAEIADSGRVTVRAEGSALDLAALVPRLVPGSAGRVEGRADATLAMTLPLSGARARGPVTGTGTLSMVEGRLRELNVPEMLLGSVGGIRLGPRLLSARVRGRYPEIFATRDTLIRGATVPFTIGGERVSSERMVVRTDAYEIVGGGWIDFDRRVRMQGDLLLSPAISAVLSADVHVAKYLIGEDGRVSVPLRMRGRLGEARPEPDARRLRARGLRALVETGPARRSDRAPGAGRDEAGRRGDGEHLERQILDRLERMLRP